MATYTGTADVSGNFDIDFGGNSYASAQKVTVTAEKDAENKTIELFAPSPSGGVGIRISGDFINFPNNIGDIILGDSFSGAVQNYAMQAVSFPTHIFNKASGLTITGAITSIGVQSFTSWSSATTLTLPNTLQSIATNSFSNWTSLLEIVIPNNVTTIGPSAFTSATSCLKVTLGSALTSISTGAFSSLTACNEIICLPTTPPSIVSNTFAGLKATCEIKVPYASLTAYQTAANWSALASKMVGV